MGITVDRRSFVAGTGALGVGMALAAATGAKAEEVAGEEAPYEISRTMDCDIVVVGSGNAGMPAAVEAADHGASVIVLEKLGVLGGNGLFTYGPSGFDTKWSRAAGITYDYREAVIEDQQMFNYIPNIHYYIDMAVNSSDNLEWVEAHGVPISDVVDNYKGGNPTAHYWGEDGGTIDPVMGRIGSGEIFIEGMHVAGEALGVQYLTETPAVDLVMDGKAVAGVIAQDLNTGEYIQVNAKATMLATGGICANDELMAKKGRVDKVVSTYTFCTGCTGDGYTLATKAGAFDTLGSVGFIDLMLNANDYDTKFQAETLEELAGAMDVDYETLQATVDRYNELCANGVDEDYGKYADGLVPIGDGPYFATQLAVSPLCSIGGVRVNRQMQACDVEWNPIEGLYVIGVDSFPFYTQMYYFQLPGSAVAFELHSGLVAARHAVENLL